MSRELDFRKFDNSMELIKDSYNAMYKTYATNSPAGESMIAALKEMKNNWRSFKGYQIVNKLSKDVASALNDGSIKVLKNYGAMRDTMRSLAKQEGHTLIVGNIGAKKYDPVNQADYTEQKIVQHPKEYERSKSAFISGKDDVFKQLDKMIDITSSDAKFGYVNDEGANPREAMHSALVSIKESLSAATTGYTTTAENAWRDDRVALQGIEAEGAASMEH